MVPCKNGNYGRWRAPEPCADDGAPGPDSPRKNGPESVDEGCAGGTGSYPPFANGWQRRIRKKAYHPPLITPCRDMASIAYSEHVGTYRHAGGNMGEMQYLYRRMGKTAINRNNLIIPASLETPLRGRAAAARKTVASPGNYWKQR